MKEKNCNSCCSLSGEYGYNLCTQNMNKISKPENMHCEKYMEKNAPLKVILSLVGLALLGAFLIIVGGKI